MQEPTASRPYMPGYGVLPAVDGEGLLPWSWADERLRTSHDYWLATVRSDGRPHVMPVWGVWFERALWFSSSRGSRKVRNLSQQASCVVTTDNAVQPVVVEGHAELVTERQRLSLFLDALNAKYETQTELDFLDPAVNAVYRVQPLVVIALDDERFRESPTRWRFH